MINQCLQSLMLGCGLTKGMGADVVVDELEASDRGGASAWSPIRHQAHVPLGREPSQCIPCNQAIA